MKKFFPLLVTLFLVTSCASVQKITRGILTDAYESESEVMAACMIEIDYRGITDEICAEAVNLYREYQKAKVVLDAVSFRDWIEQRIRDEIGI